MAAAQARLFVRRAGQLEEQILITDGDGRVQFSPDPGSEILLNAVQMREPSDRYLAPEGSAWISYWATTTFLLPERVPQQPDLQNKHCSRSAIRSLHQTGCVIFRGIKPSRVMQVAARLAIPGSFSWALRAFAAFDGS